MQFLIDLLKSRTHTANGLLTQTVLWENAVEYSVIVKQLMMWQRATLEKTEENISNFTDSMRVVQPISDKVAPLSDATNLPRQTSQVSCWLSSFFNNDDYCQSHFPSTQPKSQIEKSTNQVAKEQPKNASTPRRRTINSTVEVIEEKILSGAYSNSYIKKLKQQVKMAKKVSSDRQIQ